MSCETPGEAVDQLVACLNETYRLDLPRADDFPEGSPIRALYALPVARFERRPPFRCWAVVDASWSPVLDPLPFTPTGVAVYLGAPSTTQPAPGADVPTGG